MRFTEVCESETTQEEIQLRKIFPNRNLFISFLFLLPFLLLPILVLLQVKFSAQILIILFIKCDGAYESRLALFM